MLHKAGYHRTQHGNGGMCAGCGPLLRRCVSLSVEFVLALLVVYTLIFLVFAVLPVDPARALLGPLASSAAVSALRAQMGLDEPLLIRYFTVLGRVIHGDFGSSFYFGQPALDVVLALAPITLLRSALGLLLGFFAGLSIARLARQLQSRIVPSIFLLIQTIPSFCLVVVLMWISAGVLGATPLRALGLFEALAVLTIAAYPAGAIGIYIYDRLDYREVRPRYVDFLLILHAPAAGLVRLLWGESLAGAIAIAVNSVPVALTATTFAEIIFGLRGFGAEFIHSCERGDLSIVTAGTMLLFAVMFIFQRVSDLALEHFDPRIARDL